MLLLFWFIDKWLRPEIASSFSCHTRMRSLTFSFNTSIPKLAAKYDSKSMKYNNFFYRKSFSNTLTDGQLPMQEKLSKYVDWSDNFFYFFFCYYYLSFVTVKCYLIFFIITFLHRSSMLQSSRRVLNAQCPVSSKLPNRNSFQSYSKCINSKAERQK